MEYSDKMVDEQLIKNAVNEQLKAAGINIQNDDDARPQQPIKLNIGGTEYSFSSQEEMNNAINNAFSAVAQNQAELLAQLEELQKYKTDKGENKQSNEPQFDKEKFVKLIQENPIEAFNYLDEVRYGPDRVPPTVKEKLNHISMLENQLTAYKFLNAHPEFQNTDQNAQILRGVASQLNIPLTYEGLEAAYRVALSYCLIQPAQNQYAVNTTQTYGTNQGPVTTPPAINRTASPMLPEADIEEYLNKLDNSQLEALIRQ
jgi:hypothetical protein